MKVENIYAQQGDFCLNIPCLHLSKGLNVFVGPSGSGKTTLFRVLLGLQKKASLRWKINHIDVATLPVEERRLGVVFQDSLVFSHLSVIGNVRFAAKARNVDFQKNWPTLKHLLNLQHLENRKASTLSGGERQRLALCVALIGQPRALLLDEPTAHLDKPLRMEVLKLIEKIRQNNTSPILMSTHHPEELPHIDRLFCLKQGQLVDSKGL